MPWVSAAGADELESQNHVAGKFGMSQRFPYRGFSFIKIYILLLNVLTSGKVSCFKIPSFSIYIISPFFLSVCLFNLSFSVYCTLEKGQFVSKEGR